MRSHNGTKKDGFLHLIGYFFFGGFGACLAMKNFVLLAAVLIFL
jgi:hypothetical protein